VVWPIEAGEKSISQDSCRRLRCRLGDMSQHAHDVPFGDSHAHDVPFGRHIGDGQYAYLGDTARCRATTPTTCRLGDSPICSSCDAPPFGRDSQDGHDAHRRPRRAAEETVNTPTTCHLGEIVNTPNDVPFGDSQDGHDVPFGATQLHGHDVPVMLSRRPRRAVWATHSRRITT
jgi:hypothetical protein